MWTMTAGGPHGVHRNQTCCFELGDFQTTRRCRRNPVENKTKDNENRDIAPPN